ncbi:MAG: hypothetical protein K0S76_757 [Herbinix sp.]|jgi:hypothetical protein|nr:hypothetical protein [Herbinix sp.]
MHKAEEFIKRGLIIGLAVLTLGGIFAPAMPATTVYAETITSQMARYSVSDFHFKGNVDGHTTGIEIKNEKDWEYITSDDIITSLSLPMGYANPGYVKGSEDAAKAVNNYYYIGTIIYNDTLSAGNNGTYNTSSLSDSSKADCDTLYKLYNDNYGEYQDCGYSVKDSKEYAETAMVKQGCKQNMKDLPLIYAIITGKQFDYKAWVNSGVSSAKNYSTYKMPSATTTPAVKQGKLSNYATKVSATSSNTGVATTYATIVNGEARVYVKGTARGNSDITVKTTLNDGQTISYKTKVTITTAGSPISYETSVNPLSYAGYCIQKDTANWLGYLSKFGNYYSNSQFIGDSTIYNQTGTVDVLSVDPHPSADPNAGYYNGSVDFYKFNYADTSEFMYNFLDSKGIFAMAASGQYTQYHVYSTALQAILEQDDYNIDNGLRPEKNEPSDHYTLEGMLNGRNMDCGDEAAIAAGVAKLLGIPYYTTSISNDVKCMVVLDGKIYNASADIIHENNQRYNTPIRILSNYNVLNNASLKDLASGKYKLTIKADSSNGNIGAFYKVTDTYEAGRFQYGIDASSIKVDTSYGLLKSGIGDTRMITFHSGISPQWQNNINNAITFRYSVPYMEKTFFGSLKLKSTTQLNLVNSDWSDWTIKTSSSKIAAVTTTGKITVTGKGTATITLTHKTIKGLSIKVMVSTSSVSASTAKSKTGTFYTGNDGVYGEGQQVLDGNYKR